MARRSKPIGVKQSGSTMSQEDLAATPAVVLEDSGEVSHDSKRLRAGFATFDEYAGEVLERSAERELDAGVEDVVIAPDIIEEPDGYSDMIDRIVQEVDEALDVMDVPPKVRTAIILLRWLCESHTWEKTVLNDCVLSKLLLGDGARAHIDGIYIPVFCVWRRQMKFTLKHIRDMTDIMHLARAYLSTLMADDVTDGWASVVLFL